MRYKAPFSMFQRRVGKQLFVWYYATYDENGQRHQFSTGCVRKSDARKLCHELFRDNRLLQNKSPLFADYTADWFDYDKCLYIKSRLIRGFTYSRSFADGQRSTLQKILLPYFGKYPLDKISVIIIEKFLTILKDDGYANVSVNHYLSTLKVIITEAFRRGDITVNPVLAVRPLSDNCREKGVFTKGEVQKLFGANCVADIWEGQTMHWLYNMTAAQTGMRCGEIQALLKENVYPDHIDVQHSWDRIYGLKGTKTNKARQVPISCELYEGLRQLAATQTKGDFIFSMREGETPVDHSIVYKWFRRALEHIGVTEEKRKERNLSFHSWRHYVNSQLRANGVPDSIVQSITGHSDLKMTEHYTHVQLEDMDEVRNILTSKTNNTNKKGA
ncbi:recombinase [Spirochaetia bacterium]|nr:recombinase [Spirochaetia bacterium]